MPRGTPTSRATIMAPMVSSAVTWRRLRIIWSTGNPLLQLLPRSARRAVQREDGPEGAHGFRAIGALGADDLVDHRARDEPHHQEDGEADAEQGGEERDDANYHEAAHGGARRSGGESAAGQRSSHTVRKP